MSQNVIARRYAKALINLVVQEKELEIVEQSLTDFTKSYRKSLDLQVTLANSKLPIATKTEILKEILATMKLPELVCKFIRLLYAKRRLELLPEITTAFQALLQERLGRVNAYVTVAKKLSKADQTKLQQQFSAYTGKKVKIHVTTDASIIGGIITRIGSIVIDGSIRNQLIQVRQSIITG